MRGGDLAICPHCGFDLARDAPLTLGPASYDAARGFSFDGKQIALTAGERIIVQSLMKARGAWLGRDVLLNRLGSECVDRIVDSHVKRLRKKFRSMTGLALIETEYGTGYRWRLDEAEAR